MRLISPAAVVSTLVGAVGTCGAFTPGVGVLAVMNRLAGVWVAASGFVFVADQLNNKILQVAPDGTALAAFTAPTGTTAVALHPLTQAVHIAAGNVLYLMACPATATQTPSESPSRTRSPTLSGTATASQTGTPSPSLTLGATPSVTPSGTGTPSFTPTPSHTGAPPPPAPQRR